MRGRNAPACIFLVAHGLHEPLARRGLRPSSSGTLGVDLVDQARAAFIVECSPAFFVSQMHGTSRLASGLAVIVRKGAGELGQNEEGC